MQRKTNVSKGESITIITSVICLVIASVVLTACSGIKHSKSYNVKHSELYNAVYESVSQIPKSGFYKSDDNTHYILKNIHTYNKTQGSGYETTTVIVKSDFFEDKESKENHLEIHYTRKYTAAIDGVFNMSRSSSYDIKWYPKYFKFRDISNYAFQDKKDNFHNGDAGEWITVPLENKIIQADASIHNAVLLMSEYYPILEKEMNINFSDYGYSTNFSEVLSDVKALLPKEELNQSQTNDEQTNRDYSDFERDDFDFEANNNNAKDDNNSYNYQYDQPEQPDTNNDINDFDKEEREYAKKQKELSRKNYKNAMAVLNKIESAVNKGDLGSYDKIYALYEQTIKNADFTNRTYNMKSNIETVLSLYQDYCSESGDDDISIQNRDYNKQQIHRQIDEFKEQWQDLSV